MANSMLKEFHEVSEVLKTLPNVKQARRQGGFEGVRSNPPFGLQKILYTVLTIHFKCPTIGKWSTTGTSSLAAVENHRCGYQRDQVVCPFLTEL